MASGARPCSNQRDDDNAVSGTAGGGRKHRAHGSSISDYCVVCGDRACSHHYYGVAACHGCKCFFWRSVKQQQQYVCRYNGDCDININHRNSCRFCRFKRCLSAGMQVEAVRMAKPSDGPVGASSVITSSTASPNPKPILGVKRPLSSNAQPGVNVLKTDFYQDLDGNMGDISANPSGVEDQARDQIKHNPSDDEQSQGQPGAKKVRQDNNELIKQLIQLENLAEQEADFSENEAPKRRITLDEVFQSPEYLDCYRTRVNYCVRLRRVTVEEMEFCKYRTLAKAYDYISAMQKMNGQSEDGFKSVQDKVIILRNAFAPLTLYDIAVGTVGATKDNNLLCLPTGITVSRNEEIISNRHKIYTLHADNAGALEKQLSPSAEAFVRDLRDRVHASLYQHCADTGRPGGDPALRFAKLLHVLPKLTLLARDLVEHIRMVQTFATDRKAIDPIFFQLFGDIFQHSSDGQGTSSMIAEEPNPFPSPEMGVVNFKLARAEVAAPPGTFTQLDGNGLTPFVGSGNALFPSAQSLDSPNFHGDAIDVCIEPNNQFWDSESGLEFETAGLSSDMATILSGSGWPSYSNLQDLEEILAQLNYIEERLHENQNQEHSAQDSGQASGSSNGILDRNAIKQDDNRRWRVVDPTDGRVVVPYTLAGNFSDNETAIIKRGMDQIENYTCVKFRTVDEVTLMGDIYDGFFVEITSAEEGCSANVGRVQGKKSGINYDKKNCIYSEAVLHEMFHALGLDHEQCRPDSEDYIIVHYDNIEEQYHPNFKPEPGMVTYDFPYDYTSLMHYTKNDFAINSSQLTIETKNPYYQDIIGHATEPSAFDYYKICVIYKCSQCIGEKFGSPWVHPRPTSTSNK
ncbi:astacin (Peptidase family m12A) domain-containing protein [Ditylenchus destructor]|nr:astacin (Peptidase family m12A) domain-containing protein [Ditylenchus destructor]